MTRIAMDLAHGKWSNGDEPPKIIAPHTSVAINSQKQTGASYGTTGAVSYSIGGDDYPEVEINWDKPYGGGGSFVKADVQPGTHYKASVEGITDNEETYKANVVVSKR